MSSSPTSRPRFPYRRRAPIGLRLALLLLALLLPWAACQAGPAAGALALRGEWTPAPGAAARPFDPSRLNAFGRRPEGAWLRLHPRAGAWPQGAWVLSVESAGFQRITLHVPGAPPRTAQLLAPSDRHAFGRLVFELPRLPAGSAPLVLHVDARDTVPSPLLFALREPAAQQAVEARWLAFATACLVIMLATAAIALVFGLRLRDAAFVWYAAYVLAYALIQATQSGYIVAPLGWTTLAATLPLWGRAVTTLSVIAAVLFLDHFAELPRRLPRVRRALQAYVALMLLLVALSYVPGLHGPMRTLVNPVLILGGPLVLGVAAVAAWRGSRYALIFLLGWVPLLAVTVLGSLQLYGIAGDWPWSDDAALAAGAFEAIVLSLGLAERAASVRRQRDQARLLAGTDPLTGVLNRRAWREAVQERLAHDAGALSVLYLDLDHFKRVNDRIGHEGGDRVLRLFVEVLRGALRERDAVGRYGGEEFVVGLARTGPAEARAVAERIRSGLRERGQGRVPDMPLTVSIGLATRRPGESLDELLRRADAALYEAKRGGRDQVVGG
ncbi:MAG: diguanylate cyclase [Pseudomonadota bacterium]